MMDIEYADKIRWMEEINGDVAAYRDEIVRICNMRESLLLPLKPDVRYSCYSPATAMAAALEYINWSCFHGEEIGQALKLLEEDDIKKCDVSKIIGYAAKLGAMSYYIAPLNDYQKQDEYLDDAAAILSDKSIRAYNIVLDKRLVSLEEAVSWAIKNGHAPFRVFCSSPEEMVKSPVMNCESNKASSTMPKIKTGALLGMTTEQFRSLYMKTVENIEIIPPPESVKAIIKPRGIIWKKRR